MKGRGRLARQELESDGLQGGARGRPWSEGPSVLRTGFHRFWYFLAHVSSWDTVGCIFVCGTDSVDCMRYGSFGQASGGVIRYSSLLSPPLVRL